MKLHKKMKRTTKQYIVVAFICIIIIGGSAIITSYLITNQIRTDYESRLKKSESEINANQRSVYVALKDIKVGEEITKHIVEKRRVYSSQAQETYITEKEIGKLALIDIPEQTYVMHSMVTDYSVASELRETEYQVIYLGGNISSSDTVDIRLFFPNGEDYIILTKKLIKNIAADNLTIYLWLSEEEILRMSSAIVDTYLYNGAKLYVTKYVEPNLQKASATTYKPSLATLQLIQNNPNIIETAVTEVSKNIRKALENRLADSMNTDVRTIEWELSPNKKESSEDASDVSQITDSKEKKGYDASYLEEVEEKDAELDYGP